MSIGDGERANETQVFNPSLPSYSGGFLWRSAPTHTVDVAALQLDSSNEFRFGRTDGIVLVRASMGNANIALNVVAGGSGQIPVSASPPTGFTFGSPTWVAFAVVDGLLLQADELSADSGNLRVPILPNATYLVIFEANLMVGAEVRGFYSYADPEAAVGTAINIVAEAPPVLTSPADAATSVPLIPTFEFTPPVGADRNTLTTFGMDPYGEVSQQWIVLTPATAKTVPLPGNAGLRAQLNPSSDYSWSVISVFDEAGTLDGANFLMWLTTFFNPGADVSIATTGRKARVDASSLDFTTALE